MKPLLFAGLALALSVPAWSQPQQPPPPPAPDDRPAPGGPPQVGGPIQLQNPHRRGEGGPMMGGGGFIGGRTGAMPWLENSGFAPVAAFPAPPPVSMFADGAYLFILRGDTLMQFDKKSLTLLKTVEIPHPLPGVPIAYPRESRSYAPLDRTSVPVPTYPYASNRDRDYDRDKKPDHDKDPVPDGQESARTSPPLLKRPNPGGSQ